MPGMSDPAPFTPAAPCRVAHARDLKGDGPHAVNAGGIDLVLVRTRQGLRAFEGRCPHQGAMLGEGEIDGVTLVCRNHRWRFGLADGGRIGGPECLASFPVFERDGEILVDTAALETPARPAAAPTRRIADLPSPKGLPVVGNLLQIDLKSLHLVLEKWAAELGPMFRYRVGPLELVTVSSPDLVQQVLRGRPETYRRMSKIEPVFAEMGAAGVFSSEGTAWRPQRRLAMEALSHRHLKGFYESLQRVTVRLLRRWERAADSGAELDITEELKRFTVDITTLLTFGHDVNTIERDDDDVLQTRLALFFPAFNSRTFAVIPWWRYVRLPRDRAVDRALAWMRSWLHERVTEARARLAADPGRATHPSNFLEAMLSARDDEGRPFSDEVIFGNLLTMLLAGEDTTAYTLAWAVHHLCDSPESVAALRAEADAVLAGGPTPPDIDKANALAWAGATANETMRLRPVAPLLYHDALVDTELGGVHLPPKTPVVALMRPAARAAAHFADPDAFRPARWLGGVPGAHDPSVHMPFGSGPRLCPGRTLALLEMKVVLASLYKAFDVERVGEAGAVREVFAFTMHPAGLKVRLRRRS